MAGLTWHSAQSFLKTACRSALANSTFLPRSIGAAAWSWGGGIMTFTSSDFTPAVLSTVTVLMIVPLLPRRSTVTLIGPLAPAARCQGCAGNFATVQPQEVVTRFTSTSAGETLVRLKLTLAVGSPGLAEYSFCSAS